MTEEAQAPTTTADAAAAPEPVTAATANDSPSNDATSKPEPAAVPIPPTPTPASPEETGASEPALTKQTEPAEEPQNSLTKKFTDAEWKALKEFRSGYAHTTDILYITAMKMKCLAGMMACLGSRHAAVNLPNVFAEAFPDKVDAKTTSISIWGITIDPVKFDDARVSVILVKFLRARNLNVKEAQNMFISTLRWRDSFKPEEAMKEEFPPEVFGQLGHVYGHDKEGRPVTYNLYGANKDLKAVFGDVPRFLRWRVGLMEKGIALLDFETIDQMAQVHDYEGVSLSSRDANSKNAASEASSIFSNHYPELLSRKFFVNVPTFMTWIFWVFKPLLSAQTIAKMSVVGSGPHTIGKALLPVIDSNQLPKRYGGSAEAF